MADPIHQFEIHPIVKLGQIGGHEIAFTNSSLYMAITVVGIAALLVGASSSRALVPGRMQSVAELSYEFVANTIQTTAGKEGMKFFPLVFTLFMFILVSNIIGLIPYTFTVTSHIIITAFLAMLVFLTVIGYGLYTLFAIRTGGGAGRAAAGRRQVAGPPSPHRDPRASDVAAGQAAGVPGACAGCVAARRPLDRHQGVRAVPAHRPAGG